MTHDGMKQHVRQSVMVFAWSGMLVLLACGARSTVADAGALSDASVAQRDAPVSSQDLARVPDSAHPPCARIEVLVSRVHAHAAGRPQIASLAAGWGVLYVDAQRRIHHDTLDAQTLALVRTELPAFTAIGAYAYGGDGQTGVACWADPGLMAVQITPEGMQLPQTMQATANCEQVVSTTREPQPSGLVVAALVSVERPSPMGIDYSVRRIAIVNDLAQPQPAAPTIYGYPSRVPVRIIVHDQNTILARPPRATEPPRTVILETLSPTGAQLGHQSVGVGTVTVFDLIHASKPELVLSGGSGRIQRWRAPTAAFPKGRYITVARGREPINEIRAFYLRDVLHLALVERSSAGLPELHVGTVTGGHTFEHWSVVPLPGGATDLADLVVTTADDHIALLAWRQRAASELAVALLACGGP